jgi:hypothetical protein
MHKDELLQLHSLLCQVKRFFEDAELAAIEAFEDYDQLEVSPQHIHKSKTDHKRAVFLLGKGMSELVMNDDPEQKERLIERFARMAAGGPVTVPNERPIEREIVRERQSNMDHLPAFAVAALTR